MDGTTPDTSSDESENSPGGLCASLDALKVGGVAPAEGDSVSVKVDGTVTKIDGDHVYIEPETVNGQPVPSDMKETDDDTGDNLLAKAQAMDEQANG